MRPANKPTKGFRFYHSRVLDTIKFDGKSPQLFVVTKVACGRVYYRPVYDYGDHEGFGAPGVCNVSDFGKWCLRGA